MLYISSPYRRRIYMGSYCLLLVVIVLIIWQSLGLGWQYHETQNPFQPQGELPYSHNDDTKRSHVSRSKSRSERQIHLAHHPVGIPPFHRRSYQLLQRHESISPRDVGSQASLVQQKSLPRQDIGFTNPLSDTHAEEKVEHAPYLVHKSDDETVPPHKQSDKDRPEGTRHSSGNSNRASNVNTGQVQQPIEALEEMTPWSANYSFPTSDQCEQVKDRADTLPDMLLIPFEQSVKDVVLQGWEDNWIAKAEYTGPKLQEPKIDFVYNCTCFALST